jgi:1,4-dihydroxy-2-naphthoyl-CoA hydrolase
VKEIPLLTPQHFNENGRNSLRELMGILVIHVAEGELHAELPVVRSIGAPDGHLHAGSVVALAVDAAGCGCMASLPEGATGFATIELKCNHLGSPREGAVSCTATAVHLGGSTQIWDVVVKDKASGKTIALFRCTQMLLYPRSTK